MKIKIKPEEVVVLSKIENTDLQNLLNRVVKKALKKKKSKYIKHLK